MPIPRSPTFFGSKLYELETILGTKSICLGVDVARLYRSKVACPVSAKGYNEADSQSITFTLVSLEFQGQADLIR